MKKEKLLMITLAGNLILLVLGLLNFTLLLQVAATAQTLLLIASYYPQIRDLAKTHNAEGISLSFWFMLDQALLVSVLLAFQSYVLGGGVALLITQTLNLALAVIVTAQVYIYKK